MSKQPLVENPEHMDDVLSSIRKMVSEEARGAVDRLVLTPELKVAQSPIAPLRLETPVAVEQDPVAPAPFQDEVALRALISEMIREELQGELGARITRNVRKLIKREVETALADMRRE